MTQQDLSEFKCSDSEGDDADKSVKYVSFLVFFLNEFVFITVAMCRNTHVVSKSIVSHGVTFPIFILNWTIN